MIGNSSWFKAKIIIFITYIISAIIFEQIYRKPLFEKSLEIESNLYSTTPEFFIKTFKFISKFGTQGALIPLLIIVLILFPINISYTFASVIVLASYYDNILKILYGSPRPFWINPKIKRTCDGGYGNPSGHSFSSFSIYLSLWNIIIDLPYFNKKFIMKIILLIFTILFSFLISLSRIFLSIHSLNQILYGGVLGVGMYFYFFHIICLNSYSGKQFYQYITGKLENRIHSVKFLIYFLILLSLYLFRNNNWKQYEYIIAEECSHLPLYRKFNHDGFFIGCVLFLLIGAHYGLYFFLSKSKRIRPFKEEQINKWTSNYKIKNVIYRTLIFFPHAIPMILFLLIPNDTSLIILFPVKVIIPYLLTGYCFFGIYIDICIKLKLAYENIYIIYRIGSEANYNANSEEISVEVKIRDSNYVSGK